MHPPPNHQQQQQREELIRKEEARREENARRSLEEKVEAFDSYAFYERLQSWANKPIPQPNIQNIHISPIRTEKVVQQPLPVTGTDWTIIHKISADCARLLTLLRALDERGMECPYIHQQNRACLQIAVEHCIKLQKAGAAYLQGKGFWHMVTRLFRSPHINSIRKDLELLKNRLEAVQILCRHQEFAQDLQKMKAAITYRTRGSLGEASVPMPVQPIRGSSIAPVAMRSRERLASMPGAKRTEEPFERLQTNNPSGTVP